MDMPQNVDSPHISLCLRIDLRHRGWFPEGANIVKSDAYGNVPTATSITLIISQRRTFPVSPEGAQVMPRNGETSKQFGVFRTLCCDAEIVIGIGVAFPDCPNHRNLPTEWKQIADVDPVEYKPNTTGRINISAAARKRPSA
jgi:hypothetical protein